MTAGLSHNLSRMADALERIAAAVELQAQSDPLTMLNAALGDAAFPDMAPPTEPQKPTASNGLTLLYQHPDPDSGLEIVARRDETARGGWRVEVELK